MTLEGSFRWIMVKGEAWAAWPTGEFRLFSVGWRNL